MHPQAQLPQSPAQRTQQAQQKDQPEEFSQYQKYQEVNVHFNCHAQKLITSSNNADNRNKKRHRHKAHQYSSKPQLWRQFRRMTRVLSWTWTMTTINLTGMKEKTIDLMADKNICIDLSHVQASAALRAAIVLPIISDISVVSNNESMLMIRKKSRLISINNPSSTSQVDLLMTICGEFIAPDQSLRRKKSDSTTRDRREAVSAACP